MTREDLIAIISNDGKQALFADQRASTLSQIETMAGLRFGAVKDFYLFLKKERIWPHEMRADSIYSAFKKGKFSGRGWSCPSPSFDDLTPERHINFTAGGWATVAFAIGVARAERTLTARISKEKPRLDEAYEYLQGFKGYNPELPKPPAPEQPKPENDYIDAEYSELPVQALPAPEQPKPPAPEQPKPPAPEQPKPLHLEVGIANTDRGALEEVLKAFLKTTSASNKKDLLSFRQEIKQVLISAGLIDDK